MPALGVVAVTWRTVLAVMAVHAKQVDGMADGDGPPTSGAPAIEGAASPA